MSGYIGVGGGTKSISKMYIGVDGIAHPVQKAYIGVNGVAKLWYQSGTPIGDLAIGASVFFLVNNVRTEWLIVHQGLPSSMYDSSCNGTWLMSKDVYTTARFNDKQDNNSEYSNYVVSNVNIYLRDTFINLISQNIRDVIKEVKIPYKTKAGGDILTGSNGLSAKVFIPSMREVGFSSNEIADGAKLDYFYDGTGSSAKNRRIAYYQGSKKIYWSRTPSSVSRVYRIESTGSSFMGYGNSAGVRPTLILPQDTLVDDNFNIVT